MRQGDIVSTLGLLRRSNDYRKYMGGRSVHQRDMINVGGYDEYPWGCSVHMNKNYHECFGEYHDSCRKML